MKNFLREALWNQFGASIDAIENAIKMCPPELWDTEKKFWYTAYHCLFWLDYYLAPDAESFSPPAPFTLSEYDPSGRLPDRTYTKEELLDYLNFCREKCRRLIAELTSEAAQSGWTNKSKTITYPWLEILLYNLRHVQHHAAQLSLILRQEINDAPRWTTRARASLPLE